MRRIGSWHPLSHPSSASFDYVEARLAVKSTSGEIAIVDVRAGGVMSSLRETGLAEGASLHFAGSDEYLVDASWSGTICVRRADTLAGTAQFEFPDEMITEVSPSADRLSWLFAHQPKTRSGENSSDPPYLSLWRWPLAAPAAIFPTGLDNLYAAALSPCGSFIALVGYRHSSKATLLSILSIDGALLREVPTSVGGTGSSTRWSPDGRLLGTVQAKGFAIFEAESLSSRGCIAAEFPSDMAFLADSRIAIGTWEFGAIADLPAADA